MDSNITVRVNTSAEHFQEWLTATIARQNDSSPVWKWTVTQRGTRLLISHGLGLGAAVSIDTVQVTADRLRLNIHRGEPGALGILLAAVGGAIGADECLAYLLPSLAADFPEAAAQIADAKPTAQSQPPAPVVTELEPQTNLTQGEKDWYNTLLTCKQSFSAKSMSWEDIAKRHGVSGRTAQRRLKKLQERGLPGLDDWPKREN